MYKKQLVILLSLSLVLLLSFSGCKKEENAPITELPEETTEQEPLESNEPDTSQVVEPEESVPDYSNLSENDLVFGYYEALMTANYEEALLYPHTTELSAAITADTYNQVFAALKEEFGDYVGLIDYSNKQEGLYMVYRIGTEFQEGNLTFQVVIQDQMIAGMTYLPYTAAIEDEFYEDANYSQKDVLFGLDDYPITGTLTIPNGIEAYPMVILVSGSGPSDRDSTLGPNKPFKDIAHLLANQGVATLRFDKRTYLYNAELAADINLTVFEEYTEDLTFAVDYLTTNEPNITELYIAGHSMGGYMIPRFSQELDNISGYIMLSANASGLEVLVPKQYEYILSQDGELSESDQQTLADVNQQFEILNDLENAADETVLFGAYMPYWKDLADYNPLTLVKEIDVPILILQGERDYQVTMEEFDLWREALIGNNQATFHSFEGLNHLFMYGEAPSTPEEYEQLGHVHQIVTDAIVAFIQEN